MAKEKKPQPAKAKEKPKPQPPAMPLNTDEKGRTRCWWCGADPLYMAYHDGEWGFPVADDFLLFENICLEGFQAGLSWITILRKRENFRKAFHNFDFHKVARFNQAKIERLLVDEGIIRNKAKIDSAIHNARKAIEMVERYGSLAGFLWTFEPESLPPFDCCRAEIRESQAMSKALKQHGWTFVGPTTMYAFMQAMGLVNDHLPGCTTHAHALAARQKFNRPAAN